MSANNRQRTSLDFLASPCSCGYVNVVCRESEPGTRPGRAVSPLWQLSYIRALQKAGIANVDIARAWEIGPSPVGT